MPQRTTVSPFSRTASQSSSVCLRFPGQTSAIRASFPATILCPSTVPDTPLPGMYSKSETSAGWPGWDEEIALPRGCSERDSTADTILDSSSASTSPQVLVNPWHTTFPVVTVPVLSMSRVSTEAILSTAPPSLTSIPLLDMFPAAAIMAVGVARIRAQGQNTTRTVTER